MSLLTKPLSLARICFLSATLLGCTAFANGLYAQDSLSAYILTPKAGPAPRINGPKVFGVRPGNPIVYAIPVSGQKPVSISAANLPKGVTLDARTGRLSGAVATAGSYEVTISAKNAAGAASGKLTIVVGRGYPAYTSDGMEQLEYLWHADIAGAGAGQCKSDGKQRPGRPRLGIHEYR